MLRLNPADREDGLAFLGVINGRQKAYRRQNARSPWVGVRGDCGVANSGRWAFCVFNETGGNLRIGWSCADASLKLGTDAWGFGYGGTATKSHKGEFSKFGQTYGPGDAITCMVDLDRRAIMYMKNGREIPGDAFRIDAQLSGWPLFPHVYTKEATFSVSFDGSGGAPPLQGGFQWMAQAGEGVLFQSPKQAHDDGSFPNEEGQGCGGKGGGKGGKGGGSKYVLTSFGWRTEEEAGMSASSQEWRTSVEAYVKHFTSLLELEYEAEREAVVERVQKRSGSQLQADGTGYVGLGAEFDAQTGKITLWPDAASRLPFLQEISRGRTVLLSTADGGVDVDDASKTISGEVESITDTIVLSTQYERLPGSSKQDYWQQGSMSYRIDLGPNIIAYKRIDRMLDELQRCLGVHQAKQAKTSIEKLNTNKNLEGLLLPGAPLANALYADISESSAAASKWDPMQRQKPNPQADVSKAAREADIGAPRYVAKGQVPGMQVESRLNLSQRKAVQEVQEKRRRFSLIQGPPGTGKTTTAVAIICGWLRKGKGPILASSFSNRGTDNLADGLHNLGVRVLRMGLCPADKPYSLEARLSECGVKRGEKGLFAVMQRIDVVCATCIGCGMGPLDKLKFPYIIVDEAAQVIEPAVILPLGKGAVQAVMVGDQCQLPATVLSQEAQKKGLDISMFDRLLSMGMEYSMLMEQYRMHPKIASFCSWRFYRGQLKSGVKDADRPLPPGVPVSCPLAFFHVEADERSKGASKINPSEARCVAWIASQVLQTLPGQLKGDELGIITPYAGQVSEIRRQIPAQAKDAVQVSSVDAFQGCEKEVIILSLVRANARGDVGFVSDWRRLNVALTRAKRLCVVIGNVNTWLTSECALIREWLGFHSAASADVRMFHNNALQVLPDQYISKVMTLREGFSQGTPEAASLPRVSTAARDSSGLVKVRHMALQVSRALAEAISTKNETALQAALAQAAEVGMQNSTVEEAETVLRRLAVERRLEETANGEDEVDLQMALDEAEEAGVDAPLIQAGHNALARFGAERELATAAEYAEEDGLKMALARATDLGARPEKIMEAKKKLMRLGGSRELTNAIESGDQELLRAAVERARECGGSGPEVEQATAMLQQVEATSEIQMAMESKDEEELTSAVNKARQAGMDPSLYREADAYLRKQIAQRELNKVTNPYGGSGDEGELMIALASARAAGVDQAALARGEASLARVQAAKALDAAMMGYDEIALQEAMTTAHAAGVQKRQLRDAEAALHAMSAARAVETAMATGSPEELQVAIEAGKAAGVQASLLQSAEARLQAGQGGGPAGELAATMELVNTLALTGSVTQEDLASLRRGVAKAISAGGVDPLIVSQANETLQRLESSAIPDAGGSSAKRQRTDAGPAEAAAPQVAAGTSASLQRWGLSLLELSVLKCRKSQAVESEDFDLAQEIKKREGPAATRLAAAKQQHLAEAGGGAGVGAAAGQQDPAVAAQLEAIKVQKQEAVEAENFALAAELRKKEKAILEEAALGAIGGSSAKDAEAAQAAFKLLEGAGPEGVLPALDPGVAACADEATVDFWQAVATDLLSGASGAK